MKYNTRSIKQLRQSKTQIFMEGKINLMMVHIFHFGILETFLNTWAWAFFPGDRRKKNQ